MRPFEPGDPGLVGGLWLSGRLGEGPLGVVFLGQQADGTKVAVKLLHAHLTEDPAVWEAYQRTMEELTRLSVPNIARALSTGLVGARPFLMSEYVEGIPLPDIPEPFSAAELERLAVRTAAALAGLHAAGIPHGALRPSNVIMSAQGAVLTDFGLAADREAALAADLPDWARLVQAAAGEQELPPRLATLVETCLSEVPPSAAELLRQLTAPTSDPTVTVTELAAPPAAFGRSEPAPAPVPADAGSSGTAAPTVAGLAAASAQPWEMTDAPEAAAPLEPAASQSGPQIEVQMAPQIDLTATSFDSLAVTSFDSAQAAPADGAPAAPAVDQTMHDPVSGAAASGWALETRVEPLPVPGADSPSASGVHGVSADPAAAYEAPPAGPQPAHAFDAPPPWAGEHSGGRGSRRALLVVAASVTVALLLVGIFAVTRGGGEGDPQPVAAKTGVPPAEQTPAGEPTPTAQPTETPSAPVKSQKNAGSPTPKPPKTSAPPPPSPSKKPPKPARNLLVNGGFEKGFDGGWLPRSVTFLVAGQAHSGRRAVQLQAANGYDSAVEYVVTGLKPNATYEVVGWVSSDGAPTFIGAKDFGPVSRYVSSTAKKWVRLSATFKTGKATSARIYCWRDAPGNGACDDMALYRR